ncbi:MAG: ABC transporter substrate-binding protein [Alphaproteobacteria bacterium]
MVRNWVLALAVLGALGSAQAHAAEKIKIGFVTTLSKAPAIIGKHMQDAVELALDHLGRKVGGLPAEIVYVDDEFDPEIGKLRAEELIKKDKVDFVSGFIWSNVLLQARQPIFKSETFLIGSNAGPHELAGKECSPYFFSTSWQNDQTPEAMGKYMTDAAVKRVFILSPNYPAGKDMVAGFKRFYKGEVVGEILTPWPQHADWSAEFAKIRATEPKPDAVFVFYPGAAGVNFVKQYAQSGLKDSMPLFAVYTTDGTTLKAQADAALGVLSTLFWSPDLKNAANEKFVADFKKKYGYIPSFYAAQSYDSIMLIDSAVRATGGKIEDKAAMRAALTKADFKSVRGPFKFNTNHFPIQNFYIQEVVKDSEGNYDTRIRGTVLLNHADSYAKECKMKG